MAPPAADPIFIDTNLLVFAKQAKSPFNAQATARLQSLAAAAHPLWISRQVLREYLVTMSHPATVSSPVPMVDLIADVQSFERQFQIAEDGPGATAQLLTLLASIPCQGKQIHDANIVATMLQEGIKQVVTHNVADFVRFSNLITVIPM